MPNPPKNTVCLWEDQAETDRYWNAITDPDPAAARRAFDAMMQMRKIDIAEIEAARRG
jgi:predicted 3-demethylubiquinone-9 3-methyltransferase (glyoxalase superfamily)